MTLDWKEVAQWLGWAVAGLLAFLGRNALKRIEHLERTTVSKTDLDNLEDRLNEQSSSRHEENSERLLAIDQGVRETHGRIDDIYRDLLNKRG